jgi:arsenate reductase-like glutaredoxin family protein
MKPKVYGIRNCDTMNALALLQQNPSAIRRPIVEQGAKLLVGFDPAAFDDAF